MTGSTHRCAREFVNSGLACWGTAPRAEFVVCLETPGAFGRDAITQSRALDAAVGRAIEERTNNLGGKLILIRRADRNHRDGKPLRVRIAGDFAGRGFLHGFAIDDPQELLEWFDDWDSQPLPTTHGPTIVICSNAKRDRCCAIETRPLLAALSDVADAVWEGSHLGGHRFAPTALMLPTGQALASLRPTDVREALAAAEHDHLWPGGRHHDRGLMRLCPAEQAAAAWALEAFGPIATGELTTQIISDDEIIVSHRHHVVKLHVSQEPTDVLAPIGCFTNLTPLLEWRVSPR